MTTCSTCSTCKNWSPKTNPAMAKQRMATCLLGPIWKFTPPTGKCNEWRAATAEVIEGRVAWLEKAV